jgi:diadenosine tetraphosphate (Ap4A) HIT family hydrolase
MAGQGCPVCAAPGQGDNDVWVSVSTGEVAEVHLERRSRLPGSCIVGWRHGHVAEPGDLDALQAGRYRAGVLAAGRAVRARFKPVKLNYMTPGNTVPHLHAHVLPRYQDDPAPGRAGRLGGDLRRRPGAGGRAAPPGRRSPRPTGYLTSSG